MQQQEKQREKEKQKRENIAGISHQSWHDFFLLSSLCPSWLRVLVFLELNSCVLTSLC